VVLGQHHVAEAGQAMAVGRAGRARAAIRVEADVLQVRSRPQPVVHAQVGVAVDGAGVAEIGVGVDGEVAGRKEAVDQSASGGAIRPGARNGCGVCVDRPGVPGAVGSEEGAALAAHRDAVAVGRDGSVELAVVTEREGSA
jgi:hypothetical protein